MPFPLIPVIGAGASILGNLINTSSQKQVNESQQQYADRTYKLQRADALADWNRQNEYNSPMSQMARLRDAGLNPNLVYGHGSNASNASPVRSTESQGYRPVAPTVDFSGISQSLMSGYDTQLKQAQIDNLKAQNTVSLQDALLKAAQTSGVVASTAKTNMDTESGKFSLSQAQRLADTSAEMAQQQLRKVTTETDIALSANERAIAQNSASLASAAEAILKSRSDRETAVGQRSQIQAQIENIRKDTTLKQLDIELRKLGITNSDPLYARLLARILGDPSTLGTRAKEFLQKTGDQLLKVRPETKRQFDEDRRSMRSGKKYVSPRTY